MHAPRLAIVAGIALLAWPSSCNTTGYQRADKTGIHMDSLRAAVLELKDKVNASAAKLSNVLEQADVDPKKPFDEFERSVDAVRSARSKAGSYLKSMKNDGAAYFVEWESQAATINDPALKQSAHDRRARLTRAIDDVDAAMKDAEGDLALYTSSLSDIQTFLANDLTPAGIQAAREKIQLIRRDASSIGEKLDRVVSALDKGAPEFKTAKPPPREARAQNG